MKKAYTAPKLVQLGEVPDLTRGQGWRGNSDSIRVSFWGFNFTVSYGVS